MRQNPKVLARLAALSPSDDLDCSVIVSGEVLYGVDRLPPGNRRDELRRQAEYAFSLMDCVGIRPSADEIYARIKLDLEIKGTGFGENDLWIAACAMDVGAVLVTRDRAFSYIPSLTIEDWTL
jgi:tRNA(fMet)-specific endonuclease VapC